MTGTGTGKPVTITYVSGIKVKVAPFQINSFGCITQMNQGICQDPGSPCCPGTGTGHPMTGTGSIIIPPTGTGTAGGIVSGICACTMSKNLVLTIEGCDVLGPPPYGANKCGYCRSINGMYHLLYLGSGEAIQWSTKGTPFCYCDWYGQKCCGDITLGCANGQWELAVTIGGSTIPPECPMQFPMPFIWHPASQANCFSPSTTWEVTNLGGGMLGNKICKGPVIITLYNLA